MNLLYQIQHTQYLTKFIEGININQRNLMEAPTFAPAQHLRAKLGQVYTKEFNVFHSFLYINFNLLPLLSNLIISLGTKELQTNSSSSAAFTIHRSNQICNYWRFISLKQPSIFIQHPRDEPSFFFDNKGNLSKEDPFGLASRQ